jgi:ankyrin repeat protein
MLQCLVAAVRPLRVEELAEVMAFDFDAEGIPKLNPDWRWENHEEAVMSACSSLVVIVEDGDSRIVQFSHFSVKEFLTADRLTQPVRDVSRYHIRLDTAHTILARACLGVILQIDDRIDCDRINNFDFPLALYAGQYWTTHAQFETVSSRIKDGMERLFDADRPHFAIWLWLYDEEAPILKSLWLTCPPKPEVVPLYHAAKFGFRDLAEHLIAEHPDQINALGGSSSNGTPMHSAANAGDINMLSLLLEHGADVDARNKREETPLLLAAWNNKCEAAWYLIDRGADINVADIRNNNLLFTSFGGKVENARMLVERGVVANIRNSFGETPLHQSIRWKNFERMRLYLELGLDPNLHNYCGDTPSYMVLSFKRPEIYLETLFEYGAEAANSPISMRTTRIYPDLFMK